MLAPLQGSHFPLGDEDMTALTDFSITQKWPATRPDLLQLYSLPTPNGVKVSIML